MDNPPVDEGPRYPTRYQKRVKSAKRLGSLFSIAPINEVYDVHGLAAYDNWTRINHLDPINEVYDVHALASYGQKRVKSAKRLGSLFSIAPINEVYDVHALASYDNWAR